MHKIELLWDNLRSELDFVRLVIANLRMDSEPPYLFEKDLNIVYRGSTITVTAFYVGDARFEVYPVILGWTLNDFASLLVVQPELKAMLEGKPKQIPRTDLIEGRWYKGEGRFSGGLGFWTGLRFVGLGYSFGEYLIDDAGYGERGFSPFELIEKEI